MTTPTNDANPNNEEAEIGNSVLLDEQGKPKEDPKPVETAKPDATKTDLPDGSVVEYESTGDTGLDMALDFVGKAGISGDHPAMQAAAEGDFSILKAVLAQKGVAGWEQYVKLGEDAYARTKAAEATKSQALVTLVHDVAGGKEEWEAVKAWASENAEPAEKAQINALLNQGGLAAKGAVTYLVNAYNKASNVTVNPKDPTANAARNGGTPDAATGPLDPKAYAKAVGELNHKLNGRLEGSKEYEALQRRRQAYKG